MNSDEFAEFWSRLVIFEDKILILFRLIGICSLNGNFNLNEKIHK